MPEDAVRAFLLVGVVVFLASAIGLATAHAFSVSYWPANAVLVGLMLRNRRLICPSGWLGALLAYIAADLCFGRSLTLATFFAGANVIGTFVATALLLRLDERDLGLRRVHSVLRILGALLPGCVAAALMGGVLVVVVFKGSFLQTMTTWPASELVNYLTVLPAMLTVPAPSTAVLRARPWRSLQARSVWPIVALALSCAAAVRFDGPGSIMFPMPALLLCALTYSIPVTAMVTMALGTGCLVSIGLGIVDIGQDLSVPAMVVSIRVAVAFLILVPLTISSAMAVRDDLLLQLRRTADHDGLTRLLNRRAFEQRLHERLGAGPAPGRGLAVLWLDLDHFKAINDHYGHMAGDAVLTSFAETARSCCREGDLVGRWGGEEFALLVDVSDRNGAGVVADRLLKTFASHATMWEGTAIYATISIGACYLEHPSRDIPGLILQLDQALYRAKRKGRNRVEWIFPHPVEQAPSARSTYPARTSASEGADEAPHPSNWTWDGTEAPPINARQAMARYAAGS